MPIARVRIRRAVADDATAIASVRVDTWRSAYRGLLPDALLDGLDPADGAGWRRGLESLDPTRVAHVADLDGVVVGFATGGRARAAAPPGHAGEIYALYVRDAHQGNGIGRRLLRASAAGLVERGLVPIVIWTLFDNPASRGFYEALGGKVIGEKREAFEGYLLHEVAYGWDDPAPLLAG
jgi:ribosomal protein S18 acetylase RimI-like enzyme